MRLSSECQLKGYSLRPATTHDVDAIMDLDRSHMKAEVERYYPGHWDETNARRVVQDNLSRARVLTSDGHIVGTYYWWIEKPDTAVLHSVQVAPDHRNRGLGRWLMQCFEAEATAFGARKAGLAVFKGNPALELYGRQGYKETGTDGPHAIEMQKELANKPSHHTAESRAGARLPAAGER